MTTTIDIFPACGDLVTHVGQKFITFYYWDYDQDSDSPFDSYDGQGSITSFTDNREGTDRKVLDRSDFEDDQGRFVLPANSVPLHFQRHGELKWIIDYGTQPDGFWTADPDVFDIQKQSDKMHPQEVQALEAYCQEVLNEYNSWLNGDVYKFEIQQYALKRDEDGVIITGYDYYMNSQEALINDCTEGFIEMDNFQQEFLSELNSIIWEEAA